MHLGCVTWITNRRVSNNPLVVPAALAGKTLAAAVRSFCRVSWAEAERLIVNRHVRVDETLCLNEARRLRRGEKIEVLERPMPAVPRERDVRILHVDADLVVVDKPAHLLSLRRGEEHDWGRTRKDQQPPSTNCPQKCCQGGESGQCIALIATPAA